MEYSSCSVFCVLCSVFRVLYSVFCVPCSGANFNVYEVCRVFRKLTLGCFSLLTIGYFLY